MNYFKRNILKMQLLMLTTMFSISSANNLLDVEDILDDKFMPGSLLLLEGTDTYTNSSVEPDTEEEVHDGSILGAISTMGFHRQKMNEYLCRSYIAGQILSDMSFSRIRRRLGQPYPSMGRTIPLKEQAQPENSDIKEALLADEGSSNYKHWLKKSMTLEDIYRQLKDRESNEKQEEFEQAADTIDPAYEETGYGVLLNRGQNRVKEQKVSQSFSGYGQSGTSGYGQGGYGGSGYGHSGGGYEYAPHPVQYTTKGEGAGKNKDLILTNLFEIALTAIAFISFGCFILQVIMCITTATTNTTTVAAITQMLPMMMPTELPVDPFEGNFEPIKIRVRRGTEQPEMNSNAAMNELSRRVLLSIEAAMVGPEDNANCLRRKLCEDNRYSRDLQDNQKLWIPVWSFGMSWLSGRIGLKVAAPTAMLDSLKASILGLGNANCEILYSNCSLHTLRTNRRRKRSYDDKSEGWV